MAASAGQVFTGLTGGNGTGQGRAAILDQYSDFDAQKYYDYWRGEKAKLAAQRAEKAKADQKRWDSYELDVPDVWELDAPYIQKDLLDYDNKLTEMKMSGLDPEQPYGKPWEDRRKMELALARKKQMADESKAYGQKFLQTINNDTKGEYDKEVAAAFKEKFFDPKLTPEERHDLITNMPSLVPNYSFDEFVLDTIPDMGENKSGTMQFVDKEAHKQRALSAMADNPALIDIFKKKGFGNTAEEIATEAARQGQLKKPPTYTKATASGGSSSGSGGGGSTPKVQLGFDKIDTQGLKQDVDKNVARVIRTGTQDDLPPIRVNTNGAKDSSGKDVTGKAEDINFQPVEFVLGDNGKIGVRGIKYVKSPLPNTPDTEEEVWIDYDRNKAVFEAQIGDMYDFFGVSKPAGNKEQSMTPEQWQAAWDKLPKGQVMVGLDGKKYKKQ